MKIMISENFNKPVNFIVRRFYILIVFMFMLQASEAKQTIQLPDSLNSYYRLTNEAELMLFKKQYNHAINNFNNAFKILEPRIEHILSLIIAYYYDGKHKEALKWIKLAAERYGITLSVIEYLDSAVYSKYSNLNLDKEYGKFNSNPRKVHERAMLNHYIYNDIFFRNQLSQFNFTCLDERNSFKLALMYDSAYAKPFFMNLINKYNFPDARDLGYSGEIEFHVLSRHYFVEKKIFDAALMSGKISPYYYASIIDYHFNWNFEILGTVEYTGGPLKTKQDYGLNINMLEDGSFIIVLPDDYENVDKRRNSIGLPPLWQNALIKGYKLPQQYIDWLKKNNIPFD